MRHRQLFTTAAFAAFALTGLAGCSDDGPTGPAGGQGDVTVQMTDASGDVRSAWISVAEVTAEGPDGQVQLAGSSDGMIELTRLDGGSTVTLSSNVQVEADTYSEVRVVIDDAAVETRDSTVLATSADLQLPGASASITGTVACGVCGDELGAEVRVAGGDFTVSGSSTTTLLLDFDVGESFSSQGSVTGAWTVEPVIIASETDDEDETGAVAGTATVGSAASDFVFPVQCGGRSISEEEFLDQLFIVHATADDTGDGEGGRFSRSTTPDSSGAYRMERLPTDSYQMGYEQEVTFENGDRLSIDASPSPATVEVQAGSTAESDFAVNGAACQSGS